MSNNGPLVSVITPAYNSERFIRACVDSVLQQTYGRWEQIIIDDGSTDRTADIIHSYSDPRLRYFYQENRGIEALAHTYNRALDEAKGELVAILENDDLWPANKLSALIPAFRDPETILAYGIPHEIDTEGRAMRRLPKQVRDRLKLPHSILFNDPVGASTAFMLQAGGAYMIAPATVVIRRSALEKTNGFQYVPNLCTTDFPTFVRLSTIGKFYFIPEVMGYYRRHRSASFRNADRMMEVLPELVSSLLVEFGSRLTEDEVSDVRKSWTIARHMHAFSRGRTDLLHQRWHDARGDFRQALTPMSPRISCGAIIGWLLSCFHCTLEPLFRFAGRASYSRQAPANTDK